MRVDDSVEPGTRKSKASRGAEPMEPELPELPVDKATGLDSLRS
jgi:hypothetical protein